jgi:tetratricopeptide (TPR) repeat protein
MQQALADAAAGQDARALAAAERAKRAAHRSPSVREMLGLLRFEAGDWGAALSELLAYRRMSGDRAHDPTIGDCYRGLGRPERAAQFLEDLGRGEVDEDTWVEGLIVRAAAHADSANLAAALAVLRIGPLESPAIRERHRRLWYAYADLLERAGERDHARLWFERLAGDDPGFHDAADRARALG